MEQNKDQMFLSATLYVSQVSMFSLNRGIPALNSMVAMHFNSLPFETSEY